VGLGFELRAYSILLWLFWRWGLSNYCLSWPQTSVLSISASLVARIIDVSQWAVPGSN
jgi:hypothetical protein